nr:RNA-directed DNA polymerase, eukaryota [Tanacetum cinerariifolium]
GIQLPRSISISHLFYADDAMFIGEWSDNNLKVGVPNNMVQQAADSIGCSILNNQFRYLRVMVGDNMSRLKAWDDIILKIKSRLSKWKVKTLSIGGRLTLLKSVLGASPIYAMSIFTVPRGVLKALESLVIASSMVQINRIIKSYVSPGIRFLLPRKKEAYESRVFLLSTELFF